MEYGALSRSAMLNILKASKVNMLYILYIIFSDDYFYRL